MRKLCRIFCTVIIGLWQFVGNCSSENTDQTADPCNSLSENSCNSYKCALKLSILFYEAQRSGELPADNRIPWRSSSTRKDGIWSNGTSVDLTGGYFDAGDHVKFNFPQAAAMTNLAWGLVAFENGYEKAGELENGLKTLKWGTDYFKKCHTNPSELWSQVGFGSIDHSRWERPEVQYPDSDVGNNRKNYSKDRQKYKIDKEHPGSDLAGEVAALFSAASIVFKKRDKKYSDDLLKRAKELYDFADKYRGSYVDHVAQKSYSGGKYYIDELALASVWLYIATNDSTYLVAAENHWKSMTRKKNSPQFNWANKSRVVAILLAQVTGKNEYKDNFNNYFNTIKSKGTTDYGTKLIQTWGSNRHAANAAFAILVASKMNINGRQTEQIEFSKTQINSMLGYNSKNHSFLIGYGKKYSKNPHHRSSSCPKDSCGWGFFNSNKPNTFELKGGLVGGPKCLVGCYEDTRKDYVTNEVAVDYNAGFQSVVAGFVQQKC